MFLTCGSLISCCPYDQESAIYLLSLFSFKEVTQRSEEISGGEIKEESSSARASPGSLGVTSVVPGGCQAGQGSSPTVCCWGQAGGGLAQLRA